jgi:hypothetical protein
LRETSKKTYKTKTIIKILESFIKRWVSLSDEMIKAVFGFTLSKIFNLFELVLGFGTCKPPTPYFELSKDGNQRIMK